MGINLPAPIPSFTLGAFYRLSLITYHFISLSVEIIFFRIFHVRPYTAFYMSCAQYFYQNFYQFISQKFFGKILCVY